MSLRGIPTGKITKCFTYIYTQVISLTPVQKSYKVVADILPSFLWGKKMRFCEINLQAVSGRAGFTQICLKLKTCIFTTLSFTVNVCKTKTKHTNNII